MSVWLVFQHCRELDARVRSIIRSKSVRPCLVLGRRFGLTMTAEWTQLGRMDTAKKYGAATWRPPFVSAS